MAARKPPPKQFSAYVVVWSDEPAMPVGATLIDKGALLNRDWTVMDFKSGTQTGATGRRLTRLCPDCRVAHKRVGVLGHDGECGTDEVHEEAMQVMKDAQKRIEAVS